MKQYLRYFAVEFKNHREIENEIYHGRSFILYRYHCTSAGYKSRRAERQSDYTNVRELSHRIRLGE